MEILFQGTFAKFSERSDENEDAFSLLANQGRIVVCDGASESFDAKIWARILADKFTSFDLTSENLVSCLEEYESLHNRADLSWSKAAAYDRGSFSTLIVVQDLPDTKSINITAIGDSVVVLTDGQKIIKSFPYSKSEEFLLAPTLLSTIGKHNDWLQSEESFLCSTEWSYRGMSSAYLICMTDALGAWLFRCIEDGSPDVLERVLKIRNEDELAELVTLEREGFMRRDDSTLIIARVSGE